MTIRRDILDARREFEDHVARHKCRYATIAHAAGEEWCRDRIDLWMKYQAMAEWWGRHPDDHQRQAEHFYRTFPDAIRTA